MSHLQPWTDRQDRRRNWRLKGGETVKQKAAAGEAGLWSQWGCSPQDTVTLKGVNADWAKAHQCAHVRTHSLQRAQTGFTADAGFTAALPPSLLRLASLLRSWTFALTHFPFANRHNTHIHMQTSTWHLVTYMHYFVVVNQTPSCIFTHPDCCNFAPCVKKLHVFFSGPKSDAYWGGRKSAGLPQPTATAL